MRVQNNDSKNTEIIYSSSSLRVAFLSLNYLLPVLKNKTSKTDFVLCEKGFFFVWFFVTFLIFPCKWCFYSSEVHIFLHLLQRISERHVKDFLFLHRIKFHFQLKSCHSGRNSFGFHGCSHLC